MNQKTFTSEVSWMDQIISDANEALYWSMNKLGIPYEQKLSRVDQFIYDKGTTFMEYWLDYYTSAVTPDGRTLQIVDYKNRKRLVAVRFAPTLSGVVKSRDEKGGPLIKQAEWKCYSVEIYN